jgi:hypothetical protein
LEETATIANILNQLPTQAKGKKPYKRNTQNTLTKEQLDKWLIAHYDIGLMLNVYFQQAANLTGIE